MTKPLYVHDCDCCLFLASFGGVDHYVCNEAGFDLELIRRSSSDGPDYTSIPATLVRSLPDSIAAKKYGITLELAQAAGVL